jgi:hypothetical protein
MLIVENGHHCFQCKLQHGAPMTVIHFAVCLACFSFLLLHAIHEGWAVLVECKPVLGGVLTYGRLGGSNILKLTIWNVECCHCVLVASSSSHLLNIFVSVNLPS